MAEFIPGDPTKLTTLDYVIFAILIAISCSGGYWHGIIASRATVLRDVRDYLLGGKSMSLIPVSLSLVASYVSGVTVLGTPSEIYNYGIQYWLIMISVVLSGFTIAIVYLPVFFELKLSSSYEYLQLRFNRHVRFAASILFLFDEMFFLPMVVYVPALAFHQLTKIEVHLIAGIMVLVCGLYTIMGGLKAVVWTDALQTIIMFMGIFIVAIAATMAIGSDVIISTAKETGRFRIDNWSFNPLVRQTGWGALIGGYFFWTCFNSVNQTMVQRYLALPTIKKARYGILYFTIGVCAAISGCVWTGLSAFAAWYQNGCLPTWKPPVDDSLLPAFVQHIAYVQKLRGLGGIFLASVFGAALSSLSAILNACALVVVEDIIRGWGQMQLRPKTEGIVARLTTLVFALCAIVMVFLIERLGGVLGVTTALTAIASSTTCGIFSLGMLFPHVGPKGAILGAVLGAITAGTISLGSQIVTLTHGTPVTVVDLPEACAINATFVHPAANYATDVFPLFRVSYHWIAPAGFLMTILTGTIASLFLDKGHKTDPRLLSPAITYFWSEERKRRGVMLLEGEKVELQENGSKSPKNTQATR